MIAGSVTYVLPIYVFVVFFLATVVGEQQCTKNVFLS